MNKLIRLFTLIPLYLVVIHFGLLSISYAQSGSSNIERVPAETECDKREKNTVAITDPLVRVLISKGVLNDDMSRDFTGHARRIVFGALPLFRGIPSYTTHNARSEFAAIFSF